MQWMEHLENSTLVLVFHFYTLFIHQSLSKVKWAVPQNRRFQAPMHTQIFRSLFAQEHALHSAVLFCHILYMFRMMSTVYVSTQH